MARAAGNRGPSFFHGTNASLEVGDHVLPAAVTGVVQPHDNTRADNGQVAHATSSERVAWEFAERAASYVHRGTGRNYDRPPPAGDARARVYRVEPVGQRSLGVENRHHPDYTGVDSQEHVAKAWRVVEPIHVQPGADRVYRTMPKTRGTGTKQVPVPDVWGNQGTLPIDWSVKGDRTRHPAPMNHPNFYQTEAEEKRRPAAQLAPTPHEELPGQLAAFPKPKSTGYRARQRVLKGQG